MKPYLTSLAILLIASVAHAGIPSYDLSTASSSSGTVMFSPSGGESLVGQGLMVTVQVLDVAGNPIAAYPAADIYLAPVAGAGLQVCNPIFADANTDGSGFTTISGVGFGGGFFAGELQVFLAGSPLNGPTLPIEVVSPDRSGDLVVDIVDLAALAQDYNTPGYQAINDFNHDGKLDLADVGIFGAHNGSDCP